MSYKLGLDGEFDRVLSDEEIGALGYVPYTGATANVDLGSYGISASTGTFTGTGLSTFNQGLIINESGGSTVNDDFRVESVNASSALFLDASEDLFNIGVNTDLGSYNLTTTGTGYFGSVDTRDASGNGWVASTINIGGFDWAYLQPYSAGGLLSSGYIKSAITLYNPTANGAVQLNFLNSTGGGGNLVYQDAEDCLNVTGFTCTDFDGQVNVAQDNQKLALGSSKETDSYLVFTGTNLQYYSSGIHDFLAGDIKTTGDYHVGDIGLSDTGSGVSGCELVGIAGIGTPTWTTQCHFNSLFGSVGQATGGIITDAGSETINVASGTGFIKAEDVDTSELLSINWSASNAIAIPTNSTRFIGVMYNSGTPIVDSRILQDWDYDTEFPLGSVINLNGTLYILNNPWWTTDGITNLVEKSVGIGGYLARDKFVGGLTLGVTGTRNPTMTAGTVWGRTNEFEMTAIDYSTPTGS